MQKKWWKSKTVWSSIAFGLLEVAAKVQPQYAPFLEAAAWVAAAIAGVSLRSAVGTANGWTKP